MYKYILFITLLTILVTGCQAGPSALEEAATIVAKTVIAAPPTSTPSPTNIPLPTNTPVPIPTTTPSFNLTATVEAYHVLSEVDVWVGTKSGIPYRDGYLAWQQNEPIVIEMKGPQKDSGVFSLIGEGLSASNFIFKSSVTWKATGIITCGLAFRMEPDIEKGKQYQFYFYRLRGLPAYLIDVYEFGRLNNSISEVKFFDGLDPSDGATNEFVLVAQDDRFTVYINGKRQGQFPDFNNQRSEGLLAFLAWQESREGSCTFEDNWLWILP